MTSTAILLISAAAANPSAGVLLDFTASWCGPCQQMKPVVERLARQGYPIRKVDVDAHGDLAKRYRITGIPAFVLVINGKEVDRKVGYQSESQLKRMLARIPKTPPPPIAKSLPLDNVKSAAPRGSGAGRFRLPSRRNKNAVVKALPQTRDAVVRAKLDSSGIAPPRVVRDLPMAASVRIRINDQQGMNYGSGTVIDSKTGRTVILTCGHIFRGVTKQSKIHVDVFNGSATETYLGTVLDFDLNADVGLLAITTRAPIPTVNIATLPDSVADGQHVFSIGCGGGQPPSKLQMRVTQLNRYRGPDNIECTGVPKEGRSGGGLFNADGQVVGVCFAADPRDQRGLYAALKPIHDILKKQSLSGLIESDRGDAAFAKSQPFPANANSRRSESSGNQRRAIVDQAQLALLQAAANPGGIAAKGSELVNRLRSEATADRLKTVSDVFKKSAEAEVICIIRPLADPQAASRVVIINRASGKFVDFLNGELGGGPRATSKRVAHRTTTTAAKFTRTTAAAPPAPRPRRERVVAPVVVPVKPGRYRRSRTSR